MTLQIDDAFIGKWEAEYDMVEVGGDYREYKAVVDRVAAEIRSKGTLSESTFLEIWRWKGAMRVIRHVRLDEYDRYEQAFRRAVAAPVERKLHTLLGDGHKLPGVGAPTGSTILHFIHPEVMPIIDVRTVEALFEADRLSTRQRDLDHYEEYRAAIDRIKRECPKRSLREIDRALFAYHKLVLKKKSRGKKREC